MKLSKAAFREKFRRIPIELPDGDLADSVVLPSEYECAIALAYKQVCKGKWKSGNPVSMFYEDGMPYITYQDGSCFGYDLVKGTWF